MARAISLTMLWVNVLAGSESYSHQLVKETLRCENEYIETLAEMLDSGSVLPDSVKSVAYSAYNLGAASTFAHHVARALTNLPAGHTGLLAAGTCRQFHVNLAPFRHQLVKETLRCENEYIETLAEMLDRWRERFL
jgi:hypothetical protein